MKGVEMPSKKSTRKRKQARKEANRFTTLENRLTQKGFVQSTQILRNPPGEVKMSDVLSELVEPYNHLTDSYEARKKLLLLGMTAWNASVASATEGEKLINSILEAFDSSARDDMRHLLEALIHRKQVLFPHIKRYIVDIELTDIGKNYHLSVASTLAK